MDVRLARIEYCADGVKQSILQAVREAGVSVKHFCSAGICGTCRTRVLAGVPKRRDAILSAQEYSFEFSNRPSDTPNRFGVADGRGGICSNAAEWM